MPTPYDVLRDKLRDPLLALELWDIVKDQPERSDFIEQYNKAAIEHKFHFVRCIDMCAMARCKMIGTAYKASPVNTIMAHFVSYILFISSPDSGQKVSKKNGIPQAVTFSWINQAIDSVISRITNVPVDDDIVMTLKDKEKHPKEKREKHEKHEKKDGRAERPGHGRAERSERPDRHGHGRAERSDRQARSGRSDRAESADDGSIAASSTASGASSSSGRRRQPEADPKRSERDDDDTRSKTFYMDDDEDD
jgi:hypothetical protein